MPVVAGTDSFRGACGAKRFWWRCTQISGRVSGDLLK
jgi:hypothetical protein